MGDATRHLRALEHAAKEAQRVLEQSVAASDHEWNDDARRRFEADHLAEIRSDARLLGVELAEIAHTAERAIRELALTEGRGSVR
jgi:hypothetical protein